MVNCYTMRSYDFGDLLEIMKLLRSESGCPWDRAQTHKSIRMNFIEETYEACEAIDNEDVALLREELGDVLLQVVFHAQIEAEAGTFTIDNVVDEICKKLVVRHPHIFGETVARDAETVLDNWDTIKRGQKGHTTHHAAMDSIARSLPALMRAEKLQNKARKAGFDWDSIDGAEDKLFEELREMKEAAGDPEHLREEAGDFLFAAVNLVRFLKINPEEALDFANEKFLRRFGAMEGAAERNGRCLETLSLAEMDKLWDEVKQLEGGTGHTTPDALR